MQECIMLVTSKELSSCFHKKKVNQLSSKIRNHHTQTFKIMDLCKTKLHNKTTAHSHVETLFVDLKPHTSI